MTPEDKINVIIAEKLYNLKVVGEWHCYMQEDCDDYGVCDNEPEMWWTGSKLYPVYVNNEYEDIEQDTPQKDIVLGYSRFNLDKVPDYCNSWRKTGYMIAEMTDQNYFVRFRTKVTVDGSKATKTVYEARVGRIDSVGNHAVARHESATMAIAMAIAEALQIKETK